MILVRGEMESQKQTEDTGLNIILLLELQKNARNGMLRRIKADIELDKMICEIEGYNFIEYLISIENLIKSYYE